jgi:hypothetical protein
VWALEAAVIRLQSRGLARLRRDDLRTELWNSSEVTADYAGNAVKFAVPTVASGKVCIGPGGSDSTNGGFGELDVYGLKPN